MKKIAIGVFSAAMLANCTTLGQPAYLQNYARKSVDQHLDDTVLIFLGWHAKTWMFGRLYQWFEDKHKIIYQMPTSMVSSDLEEMEESWDFLLENVSNDMERYDISTVYGISLGVSPALYTANRSDEVETVIIALPADDITDIIWKTYLTKGIKRRAERNGITKEDYDRLFDRYDPINNIDNLHGKEIDIFVAKKDRITFYENAMNLIEEMERLGLDIYVEESPNLGHQTGGLSSQYKPWFR